MLIIFIFLASIINICISGNSTSKEDCTSWLPEEEILTDIFVNSTDFSRLDIEPKATINLGIGNVPDLLIDLSTLKTIANVSDNVDLIINATDPQVNDIITFDFLAVQFDDLNSLTFNNIQLKPFNTSIVHTTSTTHEYSLIFNDVIFFSGYAFDSDVFQPLARFDFYDISIVELAERWNNDGYIHETVFKSFFFTTDYTIAYNGTKQDDQKFIQFIHENYHGKNTIITDYINHIDFVLNSTDDLPTLGFTIYSPANDFSFSGGWNENITLNNDGIQVFYNGSDTVTINSNINQNLLSSTCEEDTHLPIAINYGQNKRYIDQNNIVQSTIGLRKIVINSCAEELTFTVPWNISGKTAFTRNSKTDSIIFEHLIYTNETSAVYREDVSNKMFQTNRLTILENLSVIYPGETDINIAGDFDVMPGVNLTITSKMKFDKNKAVLKIYWSAESGFPSINIIDPSIIKSKGIPTIIFTDNETVDNIRYANETYSDIIGTPIKIICGLGISEIDPSKFNFFSPNPSFSENGVWEYFWALDDNGEPTGEDNLTQQNCLWVNMTDFPEVPIIPVPTATKDPAAVNQKAMIAMIVIFVFLFVSAILGYFTKFLKQNKRDREREKQEELEKLKNERDISDTDSDFNDSEVTQRMSESDLSDHALSFVQDLSIGSDDDFSTTATMNTTVNNNNEIIPNSLSRKSTMKPDSLSASGTVVETTRKKKKKKFHARNEKDNDGKKDEDDVNTPLLDQSDDS